MRTIDFTCPAMGSLKIFGCRLHEGPDFIVRSNSRGKSLDYLIFFDSRGVAPDFNISLARMLIDELSCLGKTYLLVCRPLNMTVWATLVGFLAINNLKPTKIFTNMGFVDFTPKKQKILEDVIGQINLVIGVNAAVSYYIENYAGRDGRLIPLYSMRYGDSYRKAIEDFARNYELIVLNTPPTNPDISIERKRPQSFFSAQVESNRFNHSIQSAKVIDFHFFTASFTYDAVHFTSKGHRLIFDKIKGLL